MKTEHVNKNRGWTKGPNPKLPISESASAAAYRISRLVDDASASMGGPRFHYVEFMKEIEPQVQTAINEEMKDSSKFLEAFHSKFEPAYLKKHGKLPPVQSGTWELLAFVENALTPNPKS